LQAQHWTLPKQLPCATARQPFWRARLTVLSVRFFSVTWCVFM